MLITSKDGTWELLINYFKKHYGNEHTAADNLSSRPGIKSTLASLPNGSRSALSAMV